MVLSGADNIATASTSTGVPSELKVFLEHFVLHVTQPLCPTVPMPLGTVSMTFEQLLAELSNNINPCTQDQKGLLTTPALAI